MLILKKEEGISHPNEIRRDFMGQADTHRHTGRKAEGFNQTSDVGCRTSDYRGTSPQERLPCLRQVLGWL